MCAHHRTIAFASKWRLTTKHLEENAPQRIEIGTSIDFASSATLFWGHMISDMYKIVYTWQNGEENAAHQPARASSLRASSTNSSSSADVAMVSPVLRARLYLACEPLSRPVSKQYCSNASQPVR